MDVKRTGIDELVAFLQKASESYYNGEGFISDAEFDSKVEELRGIIPNHPFLKTIGAPPSSKIVKHSLPMGSLEKVKDEEELAKWWEKLPVKRIVFQWKMDGASISLKYVNGKLVQALSRGNGLEGEDLTANILRSNHIPKKLANSFTGLVRGECILFKEDFAKFFKGATNPRNAGNGCMRSKDGKNCEHLRLLPFDIRNDGGLATESGKMVLLKSLGFDVRLNQTLSSLDDIKKAYSECAKARESLDWEVDGVVLKMDDIKAAECMGESDGRPKSQRAYKFEAFGAETVLEDILWTIGHSGVVCPTGKVKPVEIGGVTVTNVLLNNLD
jgi:DNA ligase (NAD+)